MSDYVKSLNVNELNLLFRLFDFSNSEEMIAENTRNINEGKIDIFGLFQEDRLYPTFRARAV